jgi:hypothetical protein
VTWLLLALLPYFVRPDPAKTPGAVLTRKSSDVCTLGWAGAHRNVPYGVRHQVMSAYGVPHEKWKNYELDHLISLELGGSNDPRNLWPQRYPQAYSKDSLENALHRAVCSNRLPLDSAQRWIAHNWVSAYRAMKRRRL